MRIFVDTSSLFKKYVDEAGSGAFEEIIEKATEIAVSPTAWVEINAVLERRLRNARLTPDDAERLRAEIKRDFVYFTVVLWSDSLENKAVEFLRGHSLKSMDAIQLAAGVLSDSETFVTSDHQLHAAAKKAMKRARLI